MVGSSVAPCQQTLPPENAIPGEALAIEADTVLPDESAVPAAMLSQPPSPNNGSMLRGGSRSSNSRRLPDAVKRAPRDKAPSQIAQPSQPEEPTERLAQLDLPSEGLAPPRAGAAVEPEQPGARLPLEGSPDGIPWLRLNLPGHTAPVRSLAFASGGRRLCSAGDDKSLLVWGRGADDGPWRHERTLRWQVQRGSRGRIYTIDSCGDLVAIAGEGAMGGSGEIVLLNAATGERVAVLYDEQNGHRQVVVALALCEGPDGEPLGLASVDMDGRTLWWAPSDAGLWRATVLAEEDARRHDAALAARLQAARRLAAINVPQRGRVVVPAYATTRSNRIVWKLTQITPGGDSVDLASADVAPHYDSVVAIASSADGRTMVSADAVGSVYLWDLGGAKPAVRMIRRPQLPIALSLDLSADGRTALIGFNQPDPKSPGSIETWSLTGASGPRKVASQPVEEDVIACALGPDASAWTLGDSIAVRSLSGSDQQTLNAPITAPLRVAFPKERPFYRLGIVNTAGGAPTKMFDANLLRLTDPNQADADAWLPEDWLSSGWSVRDAFDDQRRVRAWLFQGDERAARLPLSVARTGAPTATCWAPSRDADRDNPAAVVVGTSSGNIYIAQCEAEGVAPLLRVFRGHTAAVTSVAVSRDLRYLASASEDGTARLWPLARLLDGSPAMNRWGAEFETQDGVVVATEVREDGPLYFRGVRAGDQILSLSWSDGAATRSADEPGEITEALSGFDWTTMPLFEVATPRQPPRRFQMYPYWQPLASLVVSDQSEWAYWAPSGYYDASFEGHKLFGWQVNRGLEAEPDFFLAARFRGILEKPEVMSRLLDEGSIEGAFRAAALRPPGDSPGSLANAYRLKPKVRIVEPKSGDSLRGGLATVRAEVTLGPSDLLAPPKAFANGVVAPPAKLISDTEQDGRRRQVYEWSVRLPSDRQVLIQANASTVREISGVDSVLVRHEPPRTRAKPRLFVLTVGVDQYRDAQAPKLTTAVSSAAALRGLFETNAAGLYEVDSTGLEDGRATKPAWRYLSDEYARRLSETTSPDDLLVIVLSGHGLEGLDGEYQYLTAEARFADIAAGRYDGCLSFSDLARFADVPCRKLVVLNTCHSGSIDPLEHRELKNAVRALQGDLLLTLTASGGGEEAVEGRFSGRLIEALRGAADQEDGDRDGVTSLDEVVAYVRRTVAQDSLGDPIRQTPTAGPSELIPFLKIPLAESSSVREARIGSAGPQ